MKYPEVSKRFKYAIERAGLSQQDLVDKSGVGKSSVSHYVNGTHCPSNVTAYQLAKVLNVSPVWLMGFDVDMVDNQKKNAEEIADILSDTELFSYVKKVYAMTPSDREKVFSYIDFLHNGN